jgi:uncharacterized membrane protein YhiD involved in acid resistance
MGGSIMELVGAVVVELELVDLTIRMGVSLVLGFILSVVNRKYTPKSSQSSIAILIGLLSFIGASLVVMLGGSTILTLGLVGGLSVIRFRTAVKDAVDIGFIFISMVVGVGVGAGLILHATIITVMFCIAFIWYSVLIRRRAILLVRIEIYGDKYESLGDRIDYIKGIVINKKQMGIVDDGRETIYMEFEIPDTVKNKKLVNNLARERMTVSLTKTERQRIDG